MIRKDSTLSKKPAEPVIKLRDGWRWRFNVDYAWDAEWSGDDGHGEHVTRGVYFIVEEHDDGSVTHTLGCEGCEPPDVVLAVILANVPDVFGVICADVRAQFERSLTTLLRSRAETMRRYEAESPQKSDSHPHFRRLAGVELDTAARAVESMAYDPSLRVVELAELVADRNAARTDALRRLQERDAERADIDALRVALGLRLGEGLTLAEITAHVKALGVTGENVTAAALQVETAVAPVAKERDDLVVELAEAKKLLYCALFGEPYELETDDDPFVNHVGRALVNADEVAMRAAAIVAKRNSPHDKVDP